MKHRHGDIPLLTPEGTMCPECARKSDKLGKIMVQHGVATGAMGFDQFDDVAWIWDGKDGIPVDLSEKDN